MANYQLAISNIAWHKEDDEAVYTAMQQAGFTGLEIAPTRIFPEMPYENLTSALLFGGYLKNQWGFSVPSMQSIWYGQTGNIFNPADAEHLLDYTAEAFQFAHSLNCPSLVFGCPKNRMRALGDSDAAAEAFFMQAGNLAARYGVRLAIEANPPMYTNYLNGTAEAFSLVKRLDNPGLAVNLDLSTMLAQGEKLQNFVDDLKYVSHVHISEPGLAPIQKRPEHKELALLLGAALTAAVILLCALCYYHLTPAGHLPPEPWGGLPLGWIGGPGGCEPVRGARGDRGYLRPQRRGQNHPAQVHSGPAPVRVRVGYSGRAAHHLQKHCPTLLRHL